MAGEVGRPTDYRVEHNEQAYKLSLLGLTDKELAAFFEVVESTIYEWKNKYPLFSEAIKRGKEIADAEIATSLHDRATGYDYTEEQAVKVKVGEFEEQVRIVQVAKHAPPDPTSMIFWLKNRRTQNWRDKRETELSGAMAVNWNEQKTYEAKPEADPGT